MRRGKLRHVVALSLVGATTVPVVASAAEDPVAITGAGSLLPGLYSSEWESTDDLVALATEVGKQVTFSGTFHDASREPAWITDWILEQSWQAETTPFANLSLPGSARLIASGHFDEDIRRWAGQVKAWLDRGEGRSLFLAPFQEMNGTWTPYGGDPANFRRAYGRVVDAFDDLEVDETKVRFVFAPNSTSTRPFTISDYYPGGTLVDVMAISAYNFGPTLDRWTTVPETMGAALTELKVLAPAKPIIIAQVGASPFDGSQVFWLRDMFEMLTVDPHVVGFVYFNFDKETDWRIWTGSTVSDGWRAGMALTTSRHVFPLSNWFRPGPLPFTTDGRVPSGWFTDDDGSPFEPDIDWLVDRRVTSGCNPPFGTAYCPDDLVTRAQMATFLARALDLPTADGDRFDDDAGSAHEFDINRISVAGITLGCGGARFCPDDLVDRGQMAEFLVRALAVVGSGVDHFDDDDATPHETAINALADTRITSGCDPRRFCPDAPVTRGQMAAFIRRALGG